MKITKHEHACQVVEVAGKNLVIDPGSFTLPLADLMDVVAIVITHEHDDHWSSTHLDALLALNPHARILGPAGVAAAIKDYTVEVVAAGDTVEIEPFTLTFFGGKHNIIHESIPVIDNLGVLVNETLYYPGDSYTVPDASVEVLAAPVGAPWLKIGEAMDFVAAVAPKRAFPVHEMTLSAIGKKMHNARLGGVVDAGGGDYIVLEPGESLDH
ncbi:L-ascorbate metabolism protein UlaG (beta-lactamase superfamily) [Microbacteriaceae bacterium SG_E_30_P1]|uniref:L-ascorbate metabolism protein UlaG (Beta-lactamase superfamily) n=1 Tax=Antiquaquibacter oligotrophicus TaxID=2880260 RepID=A0ABT6KNC6_9MICO|nr:MBL fold metallo-hydrolase [Antiquaquibacter oligotrophicus]MDH6181499.1 L-ascorbate metabolism protein UlaG (beta-lactamase superfamily) [Antiquaquibacter oligotrophicus]UDF12811.1 MBL fold metallo-hydrolase [Antiquaquibacter oligotrophicus]